MGKPGKYYINRNTYDTYAVNPRLCVLDAIHFLEFCSAQHEEANYYCFATPKAIAELAMKKADAYNIKLSCKQALTCLKNCKQNGDLVKLPNYSDERDEPLCPKTTAKFIWATKIRAEMTQETVDSLKKKQASRKPFEETHPGLVETRDKLIEYLRSLDIAVNNKTHEIEKQIVKIGRSLEGNVNYRYGRIIDYVDFLCSAPYNYQVENQKYCPRINSINDISKKCDSIVAFARDGHRWYDPNKHLSEHFN